MKNERRKYEIPHGYAYDPIPRFDLERVKDIYKRLSGREATNKFVEDAKKIATKTGSSFYFDDEAKLFQVFENHLGKTFALRGIHSWNSLMSRI